MKSTKKKLMFVFVVFMGFTASTLLQAQPLGSRLVVVSKKNHSISVIDLENSKKTWTAKVGYLPHEVVTASQGKRIYIANYGNQHVRSRSLKNKPGNTLSVVNVKTRTVTEIDLGGTHPCSPHGMAVSGDGRRVYVTCEARQEIVVIDAVNEQISHSIPTHQAGSHMLAVDSKDTKAYVANFWHGTVTVLDLQKRKIIAQISTGAGTEGIDLSPDDKFLYVTSVVTNQLIKVNTTTLKIVAQKNIGEKTSPIRVLVTPDGKNLVVNVEGRGEVRTYDPFSLVLKKVIKVGTQNIGLVIADSIYAYSANMLDHTVSMVNLQTGIEERQIPVGDFPDGDSVISGE